MMENKQLERLFLEDREEHQLKNRSIIALNAVMLILLISTLGYIGWILILIGKS